jgi:hypothetical protein
MTVKVFTIAHLPEELRPAWLQHLRDFDIAHPGCHFDVAMDAPETPLADMIRLLQVEPGLTFTQLFEHKP